jgi:hypothetical protein
MNLSRTTSISIVLSIVISASSANAFSQKPIDSSSHIKNNNVLLARVPIRIAPTALASYIRRFRPRRFKVGSKNLLLGRNDIRHILQGHHRRFYNPTGRESHPTQSFFHDRMGADDVLKAIDSVVKQNSRKLANLGPGGGQVEGVVGGVKYILGINRGGRVHQFYPRP